MTRGESAVRFRRRRGRATHLVAALMLPVFLVPFSSQASATLDRIKETETFKIAFREDVRPFSFKNEAGEPAGYTVDLCRRIASDLKDKLALGELKVEFVPVGTEDRFQAVAEGRADLLCGSSTATLGRRETVSFSVPTFVTGVSALLRSSSPSFLKEVLAGRKPALPARSMILQAIKDRHFGVRAGTTAEAWLADNLRKLATSATMVTVDSYDEGLDLLAKGDIDALFGDRALLVGLVAGSADPDDYLVAERYFTYEHYALAMSRGDEDFRLFVDRSLSRLYRSPDLRPIFAEHFGGASRIAQSLYLTNINGLAE